MKRLFKIMAGILALSMCTFGTPVWADMEVRAPSIPISVSIGADGTYSLSAVLSDALSFDVSGVTTSDSWRVGNAYINIGLATPTNTTWGLRIVTDNVVDLTGITRDPGTGVISVTPDASGVYADGAGLSFAGFDLITGPGGPYSYAGLIRTSAMDNPSMRAALAWQVGGYNTTGAAVPAAIPSRPVPADVGDWNDVWAYLADKANTDYRSSALVSDINTHTGGKVVYRDDTTTPPDGTIDGYVTNYTLVAYGTPYGRSLATHPGPAARPLNRPEGTPADPWNIYVYLAARFSNTDYSGAAAVDFVLPAGPYTTSIYLELFSE